MKTAKRIVAVPLLFREHIYTGVWWPWVGFGISTQQAVCVINRCIDGGRLAGVKGTQAVAKLVHHLLSVCASGCGIHDGAAMG